MAKRDPRIDAYIEKSAEFARPILRHLREVVHGACPDVEEGVKWSMPHFGYRGGMMCGMAAFKEHCTFGFWKAKLILGPDGRSAEKAMGQFGRLASVSDLPSKRLLTGYIRQAMKLNEEGRVVAKPKAKPKAPVRVPADLTAALKRNARAGATFAAFSPSHRREYVEWIIEAKGADTRQRRVNTAIEWMADGKARNWKYEKC
ncbi:MAG: YdeI family protein [Gemmatimonadales bacterium]